MINTFSPFGYEGAMISVEVDLRRGIPAIDIVGLSDGCVSATRERMKTAIKNSGLEFPQERVLISLSPADLKKEGAGFDLSIALAIIEAQYGLEIDENVFAMGELELSGRIRLVDGINAALQSASLHNIKYAIVPKDDRIVIPNGIKVKQVISLTEAYFALCDIANCDFSEFEEASEETKPKYSVVFNDNTETLDTLTGNNGLKLAMAVAVAGRHNMIVWGRPGCGKTMTLQRMPSITPKLSYDEAQSVNRIFSLAGLPNPKERPFRRPHQTASIEGMCGGGVNCKCGEISLAHNGTLFLDEAGEFRSSVLQMLRVPLESHSITLCRAGRSTVYPANFQLIMAVQPCPCGNLGSKDRICLCSAKSIEQYWKKFSAPLLDRISIRVDENNDTEELTFSQAELRSMIKRAFEAQHERNIYNEQMNLEQLDKFAPLNSESSAFLESIMWKRNLSLRQVASIKKVARTIADMRGFKDITFDDVKRAEKLMAPLPLEQ